LKNILKDKYFAVLNYLSFIMRLPCYLLFAALFFKTSHAQQQEPFSDVRRHSIYAELGGNNLIYSINYDKLVKIKEQYRLSMRVGAGYIPNVILGVPVEANVLAGRRSDFIEMGLGFTPVLGDHTKAGFTPSLIGVGRIGYRHQSPQRGYLLRIGVNMIAFLYSYGKRSDRLFLPWGGISWGYTL
jgi:hypothetical protein